MKKFVSAILFLAAMTATVFCLSSCGSDDDDELHLEMGYDVIEINGVKYACYGYKSLITYDSSWDLSEHSGNILLPCGSLSDAKKGEYDYDYMYDISLEGNTNLKKGSKLEDFSPELACSDDWGCYEYSGGSAVVTDKKDDKYITLKFSSFTFSDGRKSYEFNGEVKLSLDED